jgi:hypothetical protein
MWPVLLGQPGLCTVVRPLVHHLRGQCLLLVLTTIARITAWSPLPLLRAAVGILLCVIVGTAL